MKYKEEIKLFGIAMLWATFLVFMMIFVTAYQDEDKQATVDINYYNEANFEMWILTPFVSILGTLAFALMLYDYWKGMKNE